ncbi:ATP-dependent 6-phosphofructokinase 2-like isoform X2 [Helianthus annuus]|uniref:ATP-dependent 6-phosphofructokinase 2-like isoform X2 n=1 Tax=Helianthus annuus TaxID=4232 RepID=UPI00165309D8|nr:ATP-dependent 6-phosphofructokinase 2-like isoform X2 [Helianthus annuus]
MFRRCCISTFVYFLPFDQDHLLPSHFSNCKDKHKDYVYIIGGDDTQTGAAVIYQEMRRRGLKAVVVGIPKTIDNDILAINDTRRRFEVEKQECISLRTEARRRFEVEKQECINPRTEKG